MASNQRQGKSSAGLQRLALLVFGALFVVLFLAFAIGQGIGDPSVPSDAVAIVEDAPDDLGTITDEEFARALQQAAASAQIKVVPKPGDEKYDELKEKALGELLDAIWIQGQGEEMGIEVTPEEVAEELKTLKGRAFKTDKQFQEFLKEAHFTQADLDERVKIKVIGTKIQEQVTNETPAPSSREIEDYYEAAKSSQYTTPETRDIRLIKNKDKAKVEAAKVALEKDDSEKSWGEVAKKYSTDTTKGNGGLQSGVSEGTTLPEALDAVAFEAPQGELQGPIDEAGIYTVFEVMKITPEKVQSLDEVKSQISTQLSEQLQQQTFTRFVRGYGSTWQSRTFCASDFLISRCANFESDGRPAEADPACFEANPKAPAEACPAPVAQIKPAQPGSVSVLNAEGQRLAQRPRPAGEEAAAEAPAELPGVPPTGAPSE